MKVAKATNSQALEADALHFKSDILSSLVVLVGLVLVLAGVKGGDSFAAIGVSLFVLHAGWELGKRTISSLIDVAPEGVADKARDIIGKTQGVLAVERVRVRSIGKDIFIDAQVVFDRKLSVIKSDSLIAKIKSNVCKDIPDADITVHQKAGQIASETIVEAVNALAAASGLLVHDVIVDNLKGKGYVSYHVEVPANYSVGRAHKLVDKLENQLSKELGSNVEFYAHIEPRSKVTSKSQPLSKEETDFIASKITKIAKESGLVFDVHDVVARRIAEQLHITLHCLLEPDMSVEESHSNVTRLEHLIKQDISGVKRVVIHVEPKVK